MPRSDLDFLAEFKSSSDAGHSRTQAHTSQKCNPKTLVVFFFNCFVCFILSSYFNLTPALPLVFPSPPKISTGVLDSRD